MKNLNVTITDTNLYQINQNRRGRVSLPARVLNIKNNTNLVNLVLADAVRSDLGLSSSKSIPQRELEKLDILQTEEI